MDRAIPQQSFRGQFAVVLSLTINEHMLIELPLNTLLIAAYSLHIHFNELIIFLIGQAFRIVKELIAYSIGIEKMPWVFIGVSKAWSSAGCQKDKRYSGHEDPYESASPCEQYYTALPIPLTIYHNTPSLYKV